jgi:flagellar hook-associated protein 2
MAGITFSGFNDIDFNAVVNAIMAYESQPLTRLQTQKTALETQNTAFGTLAGKLSSLRSAFEDLGKTTSMAGLKATSSDSNIAVSAGTSGVAGTYDVVVSALAKQQVTRSTTTFLNPDVQVATGGTLVLRDGLGNDTVITVTGPLTVAELADEINSNQAAPVSASVVQTSPGTYQLVFTGKLTGSANGFSVRTNLLTGGSGVSFTDTDADNFAGNTAADNVQQASNAALTVNNMAIASASNVLTDVVPGVTMTLAKADATKTVTVQVNKDNADGRAKIDKLVATYNDFVTFLDNQRTAEIAGRPGISRDPLVRSLRDSMRNAFMAEYEGTGSFSRLAEVGIGFDRTGKLTVNNDIYEAAVNDDAADVQALFSAQGEDDNGAFGALQAMIEAYTDSGGLVSDLRERLTDQAERLTTRMDAFEAQLMQRRLALQQQFTAADQTMSRLKAQGAHLSTLGSAYRLF